jgi:hypothetical protein
MLVLVASAERWVARHDLDFSQTAPANWTYSGSQARRRTEPGVILTFGTSLAKFGVVSRVLEQETGRPAFNLAVCNGHMPSSYFLLKRALDAGARPSAVLVDCQEGPVPRDPSQARARAEAIRVNLRNWPELLTWRECLDLAWEARDANFVGEMAVARALPSYKARFEIRSCVMAVLRGESGSSRTEVLASRRNWRVNRGTHLMPPRRDAPEPDVGLVAPTDPLAQHGPALDRFRRNKLTESYIRRFVTLAASRGIPVLWLLPPLPPGVVAERDRLGFTSYATRLARIAQAQSQSVTVIDGRRSGYRSEVFWDKAHLDGRGACSFTSDVGAVLARALDGPRPGPRWVTLPAYRERRPGPPFEDLIASFAVVRSVDKKARR